jgi:hypothetical protein
VPSAPSRFGNWWNESVRSLTRGQGSYSAEFSHYETVPPNEQLKIVAAAQLAEEDAHPNVQLQAPWSA